MSTQLLIIIVYFGLTIAIGLYAQKKSSTSDSFTGKDLSILMIVAASTGEWLGGTATTGVSEYGFDFGLSGAWYTIANGIGVIFLAMLFAKLYRSLNTVTVPGIIGNFLGVKARTVSSCFLTFVMIAVGISQMIAAGSLGVSLIGVSFNVSVVVFAVVFIVYTLAGGMNAVAYTNTMHLVCMYGGILLAIFLTITKIGGVSGFIDGITAVEASDGGNYFNMFTIGVPRVSSWVIASLLGACTAQAGIQPVLAAKNEFDAKKACLITAVCAAPFGLFTAALGMVAKVMSHQGVLFDSAGVNVTNGKLALPTLMMQLTPVAGGIVLASILAAVLSTVSPIILASGTMVTKDIYQGVLKPNATDKEVLFWSRVTTAISGVLCAGLAVFFNTAGIRVLDIVYFAYSMRGALFIVVLLGIYYKKTSEKGAIWGMIVTAIVGLFWVGYNGATGHFPINPNISETYAAVVAAFVSTMVFSAVFPKKNKPA
ncbi:MAG: sodium:solute symporter family protein [Synergistaceae bacterium]|jgi:SSS family solute:Na+ symporter|nr:sodium:solute symporter family protein [Synergistaceae bacterium]